MTTRKLFASLVMTAALATAQVAMAQISFSVNIGPPPLPVYEQPVVPGDGYIWTPGYWAWDNDAQAYYWVPGAWVLAPFVGGLWTPGYWFFADNGYRWRQGYWGRQVGFYGGINYGYGYGGHGYDGGRWANGAFSYNRLVSRVDPGVVHHVYDARVPRAPQPGGVSFNGGHGGIAARPTAPEQRLINQRHQGPTPVQVQHEQTSRVQPGNHAPGSRPTAQQAPAQQRSGLKLEEHAAPQTPAPNRQQPAAQMLQPVRPAQAPHTPNREAAQPRHAGPTRQQAPEAAHLQRPEHRVEVRTEPRAPAPQPSRMQAPPEQPHPQGQAQPHEGPGRHPEGPQRENRHGPEGR